MLEIVLILFVAGGSFSLLLVFWRRFGAVLTKSKPKVGEKWLPTYASPWDNVYEVLDVKDGWVRIRYTGIHKITSELKINEFLQDYNKVKDE